MKVDIKVKYNPDALEKTINNSISKSRFKLQCPKCKNNFEISGSSFGYNVICPYCHSQIKLNNDGLKKSVNDLKKSFK